MKTLKVHGVQVLETKFKRNPTPLSHSSGFLRVGQDSSYFPVNSVLILNSVTF